MKEDKKTIFNAFANLLIMMIENNTDNIELTFNFNKCKASFRVNLFNLEEGENNE